MAWLFCLEIIAGDHLISHTVARAVPSAQRGLTSVFEMGTGDPSQYSHRQTLMALGGWLPAACRGVCFIPDGFSRRPTGTRIAIWRQKLADTKLCNEIDWCYKACQEEYPLQLRGVNSMDKPNGRLVLVSFTHYCAFTPSLSTRWSFWALQGDLILERASRLYAFSGYHNRTSLPSHALGRTTGTQEVRPSRSSRTKDSPPQISYAHSR
jgi:hypothetical protein